MKPTSEQLTRAAELAPKVAEIAGIHYKPPHRPTKYLGGTHDGYFVIAEEWVDFLDPHAFQAVVLALPDKDYGWALVQAATDSKMTYLEFIRYILTPAGMLAFYEALVENATDRTTAP